VFAEEFAVLDGGSALWEALRPLVSAALRLEREGETATWHGWNKQQIDVFLQALPAHCALIAGVWEADRLALGCVCEVVAGEVRSLRTFEQLDETLQLDELAPDFEHARAIMRVVKREIAPVAWALFTDKATWDEWVLSPEAEAGMIDKGALLDSLARQGRCVLLGSQAALRHHHH
jgi:hypothetical protein